MTRIARQTRELAHGHAKRGGDGEHGHEGGGIYGYGERPGKNGDGGESHQEHAGGDGEFGEGLTAANSTARSRWPWRKKTRRGGDAVLPGSIAHPR